jgi:hypothetical protein
MRETLRSDQDSSCPIDSAPAPLEAFSGAINLIAGVSGKVAATFQNPPTSTSRYPVSNPYGAALAPPRRGAKGRAGIRADIASGRITVRQLALMTTRAIMERYKVSKAGAWYCRQYISRYGIEGKHRYLGGEPKPLPTTPPPRHPGPGRP